MENRSVNRSTVSIGDSSRFPTRYVVGSERKKKKNIEKKERSIRSVDLAARSLGICKAATRYRVNPCPNRPFFSSVFPSFFSLSLQSTSFSFPPDQVSMSRYECTYTPDGNFCQRNRYFNLERAELRLPREDEWRG